MWGGTEEAKLKKQEKAETSQFIEDLHLVFNGFFHFISPDFFKLANKLDQAGKHMGNNKVTTATKKKKKNKKKKREKGEKKRGKKKETKEKKKKKKKQKKQKNKQKKHQKTKKEKTQTKQCKSQ